MNRYRISEEELNDIFNTSALYTKGLDYHKQKTLNDYKGQLQVDVKDYGNVIIIKKQFRSFNDLEIDFFGDGSYLSCFYSRYYSSPIFHLSPQTKEESLEASNKISLYTGNFGRSGKSKILLDKDKQYDIVQIIAKQPLIKKMAEIDGVHSVLFEKEYQKNLDHSILVQNIYSPMAIFIIEQILQTQYEGQLKAAYIELKTIELMLHLIHVAKYGEKEETQKSLLSQRAMLYLEHNYYDTFTDDALAKKYNVGKSTLRLHFKEAYGMTMQQMHNNLRMQEIKRLLTRGYSFAEIAYKFKYTNQTDLKKRYYQWLNQSQ
jgi:AraC-like DNA-binding protein